MNDMWHGLAESLRTEVAEYGRLVQIFPGHPAGTGRIQGSRRAGCWAYLPPRERATGPQRGPGPRWRDSSATAQARD